MIRTDWCSINERKRIWEIKESLCFTLQRKQGDFYLLADKEVRFVFQALNPMRRMGCGSSFTTCLPRRRLPAFTTSSWVMVRNRKVLSGMEGCDMIRWAMHLMMPCSIKLCSQRPLPKYSSRWAVASTIRVYSSLSASEVS